MKNVSFLKEVYNTSSLTLGGMGEEAVQPCPGHSHIFITCVSKWFNPDSVDFIGFHDSHHTTGSAGPGSMTV